MNIEDLKIIEEIGMANLPHILFELYKKYDGNYELIDIGNDCMFRFGETNVANVSYLATILHFISINSGVLTIEGSVSIPTVFFSHFNFYICVDGEFFLCKLRDAGLDFESEEGTYENRSIFTFELDLVNKTESVQISFYYVCESIFCKSKKINSMRFAPVADVLKNQYAYMEGWILEIDNAELRCHRADGKCRAEYETRFIQTIQQKNRLEGEIVSSIREEYFNRLNHKQRPIWLFFDRIDKADDNGEAMFRYVNSLENCEIDTYFIIGKDSPDYLRMKKYGQVVEAMSFEHRVLFLLADFILTSQLNGYVENPYEEFEEDFRDLYHRAKLVFLQHGITKDDQTVWLNRYNQNLYALVASSEIEKQAFENNIYHYDGKQIWLTGMPRYDYIKDNTKKKILIMPTWRKKYMWQQLDSEIGVYHWMLKENAFLDSDYFRKHHSLLHSEKLKAVCNKYGYEMVFMPHPIMQPYIEQFDVPEDITILDYSESWGEMFDECAIMVTDFSSVAFDFAYRYKPVIYYQFDREEFFESHSYREGYFDYQTMGFGEVITEEERLIEKLTYYLKRKCKMEPIFKDRLDNFFEFHDNHNCKRIFERLVKKSLKYNIRILEGHIVRIEYQPVAGDLQFWDIYLENVFWGGKVEFQMPVMEENRNSLILLCDLSNEEFRRTGEYAAKGDGEGTIGIYATSNPQQLTFVMYSSRKQHYEKMLRFSHRNETIRFTNKTFCLDFEGCFYSDFYNNAEVLSAKIVIDSNHSYVIPIQIQSEKLNYFRVHKEILLDSIIGQEAKINNPIHIEVKMNDGTVLKYNIGHKSKKKIPLKFFYVPIISKYYKEYALCVRGNVHQNYSLVIRKKEPIESDFWFRVWESKVMSYLFYHILGKYKVFHKGKPINLYYEKNSMKADEGTFEVFQLSSQHKTSRNYFVLDKDAEKWEELSKYKNVIRRYSFKYYVLLYLAQNFISTETSSHLNVHRSINRYVRKTLLESKFIFLQHGITYLKCQGEGSVFGRDKEGEPTLIAVGSQKEAEAVQRMLRIPIERCIFTGLPVFSTLKYKHISAKSTDIVTIMLTWKQYEEHLLENFERSTYYQNVCKIYNMLRKYFEPKRIQIVPHPKVAGQLCRTSIGESVWDKPVADALENTKLLITDYSSTCYNAFYQGAAVIFYQPDLMLYEKEVGKLIPEENEYIGYRVFTDKDLDELIQSCIRKNGRIDLKKLRNKEFVNRYQQINKYNDGKNVERIVDVLVDKGII